MLNDINIMGRLTDDPVLSQTYDNVAVCRFSIAVERPKSKDGERKTDFFNVVVWRQCAEFVSKYFTKGKPILVQGTLRNNNYTDKNNIKRYEVEILGEHIHFCGDNKSTDTQPLEYTAI